MIKIDALYLLLLIELTLALAGTIVFFVLRGNKTITLYKSTVKELGNLKGAQEKLQSQLVEAQKIASQPTAAPGDGAAVSKAATQDHENCKIELSILEEKLKEKNRLLVDLQTKFDDLEKEYLILYRQQQAQGQKKD